MRTTPCRLFTLALIMSGLLACGTAVTEGQAAGSQDQPVLSRPLPRPTPVQGSAMACQSLLVTTLFPDILSEHIEGASQVTTDQVAIEIQGDRLRFMTGASVDVGLSTPALFQVLQNDADVLTAIYHATDGSLDSFILNKTNGIAVWTKSRSSSVLNDQPDTQSLYLQCE